jgi:hypothetical protein
MLNITFCECIVYVEHPVATTPSLVNVTAFQPQFVLNITTLLLLYNLCETLLHLVTAKFVLNIATF